MTDIEQIWPAHADHISGYNDKFINSLFNNKVVAQRKYDGERMLIHFLDGQVYCTSRRISKKTGRYQENQDKIGNLIPTLPTNIGYTVIDCECYAKTWSEAASILHSLHDRAIELQKTINIQFACFDCLFIDGQDIRDLPYEDRINFLKMLLSAIKDPILGSKLHYVEEVEVKSKDEAFEAAKQQWDLDREGVVIKSLAMKYYDKGAMLKIKRFETVDCVVYGFQEGRGKYEGTVGALLIGYYDPDKGEIVHCSKVNCGTDADRDMWKAWFDDGTAVGRVLEVKCQEVTDRSLRHPVYVRVREDKDFKTCTKDTIFKE